MTKFKERMLKIIENADEMEKDEIVDILRQMILEKDKDDDEINILNDVELNNACCLPSICISRCKDCEVNTDVNLEL